MKFGAVFPTCEIGTDPVAIRDFAQAAEGLGYADIVVYDHVLGADHGGRDPALFGPYTEDDPFHEPFVLYGYLAAVTTSIELAVGVLVLPQRQTALVAKQAAELAVLSQGRFRLGVGTGWNYVEYESLGTDFTTRGRRLEEQVLLLRRLWVEESLDVDTPFHRIDRASINPLLDRPVPIWFGGFADVQQDRCARIGDGMLWTGNTSLSRAGNEKIRARAAELGRDPDTIGFQAGVRPKDGETLADALRGWEAAGGTHATVGVPLEGNYGRDLVDALPRLRDEVGEVLGS
jgi:probable F420-dependent oxidoreductase